MEIEIKIEKTEKIEKRDVRRKKTVTIGLLSKNNFMEFVSTNSFLPIVDSRFLVDDPRRKYKNIYKLLYRYN